MTILTQSNRDIAAGIASVGESLGGIHPSMAPFVQWFAPAPKRPALPAKQGHPDDRKAVADMMRAQRARFPDLKGGWTRSAWSVQVHIAGRNKLAQMTARRKKADDDYHTGQGPTYRKYREAEMRGSEFPK